MRLNMLGILIKKDARDTFKNMSVLPVLFMAPLLSFLYSRLNIPQAEMGAMWSLYGIAMVGIMLPGLTVAEEKEKNTLDSLLVSPATYLEIIISKTLFSLIMVLIVNFITLIPSGFKGNQLIIWTAILLSGIFFIQIGLIIGLFTKNQISAGACMTPAMLIFILTPLFKEVVPAFLKSFFNYMPSLTYLDLVAKLMQGETVALKGLVISFTVIISWNVVAYIFTHLGIRHQFR